MAYWDKITSRGNVEDRRSAGPLALGGGASVIGVVVYLLISLLGGGGSGPADLNQILEQLQQTQGVQQQTGERKEFAGADEYETFSSAVLGSNNDL